MLRSLSQVVPLWLRGLVSLIAISTSGPVGSAQEVHRGAPLVLTNATLIDGTAESPRPDATLVIEDGRLTRITSGAVEAPPAGARVVDLSGQFVLPGLIDAHVHVSLTPDPRATLRALASAGVTTVRDMGGDARTLAVLAREARAHAIRSPSIYYAATVFGPPFLQDPRSRRSAPGLEPGAAPWSRVVTPESDWVQVIADARGTGATGLKLYSAIAPEQLREIVREGHRQGLKVWSHATVFPSTPSDAVAAGVDVLSHSTGLYPEARPDVPSSFTESITEWMPSQDFAAVAPSGAPFDALFALMRRRGTLLEPTLAAWQRRDQRGPRPAPQQHLAEAASRIDTAALSQWACAATRAAHEAGVLIVAGTDSSPRRSISIGSELEALVECGLTPMEAIRAATVHGARAVGIEATHGSIEVGKVADLVILSADPTVDIANVRRVVATVRSGRLYDSDGAPD